jgi:non-heme chloroperoxidase
MPFITAKDGAQLHWRDWGQGAPILFLSGLGIGSQMWDYQIAAFAEEGFRCIGFDRRGHGRSDQAAHGYDTDTLADDIAALTEERNLSDLTLVTHSMGGGEAVRYMSRHGSSRVARLVLLAPMTPMLLEAKDNPSGAPLSVFQALWAQWKHDYPKWVADNVAPFFIPETSPAMMVLGGQPAPGPRPDRVGVQSGDGRGGLPRRDAADRGSHIAHPWRSRPLSADREHGKTFGRTHPGMSVSRL